MTEGQQLRLLDCILASAKMIADQLMTLNDVAISFGSVTTELQEVNRNLYDIDSKLSQIAERIEKLENS